MGKQNKRKVIVLFFLCLLSGFGYSTSDTDLASEQRITLIDQIRKVLEEGKDINAQDAQSRTPLYLATLADDPKFVQTVLNFNPDTEIHSKDGYTALHIAARHGNVEIGK